MTHEELRKRIEGNLIHFYGGFYPYPEETGKMYEALCAVMELHKPMAVYKELCRCETIYPCPTIQAIEKELK